jgi:predicted O-linked N-acetylglucosamine transferase (SPINDLY family)
LKRSENSIENKNKNKIKLGIISGDLRSHAVTKFFLPIFNLIDKNIFEIYVFSNHFKEDVFTQHYKFKADLFEKIYKKSDHEIAQMIFDKKLDILWDLSGHTGHSVNHLMALRLAKVQITGVGSPGTSGIPNIDYFYFPGDEKYALQIADQFTEKLLCTNLNTEFIVENNLPQLKPKPFESNGFLTFGIFVNSRKYTKQSWNFWISIFKNIPDSKIIFLGIGSDQIFRVFE